MIRINVAKMVASDPAAKDRVGDDGLKETLVGDKHVFEKSNKARIRANKRFDIQNAFF